MNAPHHTDFFMNATIIHQLEAVAVDHYHNQRLDRAQQAFELLTQYDDRSGFYWTMLGVIHRRNRAFGLAIHALKRAVSIDHQDRQAQVLLGEVLCTVGQPRQGVALLRHVFDAGHQPTLTPTQQDQWTQRAGAVLEALQMGLNLWRLQPR